MNEDLATRMSEILRPLVTHLEPLVALDPMLRRLFKRAIKPDGWQSSYELAPDWSRTAAREAGLEPNAAIDAACSRFLSVPELRSFLQSVRTSPPLTEDRLPELARFWIVIPMLVSVFRQGPESAQAEIDSACAVAAIHVLHRQKPVSYLVPLIGLELKDCVSVRLDDEVSITRLEPEIVDEIVSDYAIFESEREIFDSHAAIQIRRTEPAEGATPNRKITEDIKLLITLLQLETNWPIRGLGLVSKQETPLTHFSAGVSVWRDIGMGPTPVAADESVLSNVSALWSKVRSNALREHLALSRWRSALRAEHHGDRLVDLWIALESLFGAGGKTELRYRMSLRIPLYAGGEGDRRRLAKTVKQSYDLRSSLVHGSAHHERLTNDKLALIEETQLLTRKALLRVIREGLFDAEEMEERFLDEVAKAAR